MRLKNGQKVPMAHPSSSRQAGTVFHGRWAGKHRLRSRFRKAFFGIKERTNEKGEANPEEFKTERKSEYHIFLPPTSTDASSHNDLLPARRPKKKLMTACRFLTLFFESCILEEGSPEEFNSSKDCVRQYNYRITAGR